MDKRILFVDDEPMLLEGLKSRLRGQRRKWDMVFVTSGEAALKELAQSPYDAIVSDVQMPEMDGIQLLTEVQQRYPSILRIGVSGSIQNLVQVRALPVAHQFISKPFEVLDLERIIERAFGFIELINDEQVRLAIGRIARLPSQPQILIALEKTLADPKATARRIAEIISGDVALGVKILQVVHSPFFGLVKQVTSIQQAVSLLGVDFLKNLVISVELFRAFEASHALAGFSLDRLQSHSNLTAAIAREIMDDPAQKEAAFLAGLLHDVGWLIAVTDLKEQYAEIWNSRRSEASLLYETEYAKYGVSHAEYGAYLLAFWGIPMPIVMAVCNHHRPGRSPHDGFALEDAVHVADFLAHRKRIVPGEDYREARGIDWNHLKTLGMENRMDEWAAMANLVSTRNAEAS
ncbi:MAG: HDOD domain-containing protein [Myxococcales bacterium]|nr:MAG: HDOD domain-containing protein [Myxococcales bacterium]